MATGQAVAPDAPYWTDSGQNSPVFTDAPADAGDGPSNLRCLATTWPPTVSAPPRFGVGVGAQLQIELSPTRHKLDGSDSWPDRDGKLSGDENPLGVLASEIAPGGAADGRPGRLTGGRPGHHLYPNPPRRAAACTAQRPSEASDAFVSGPARRMARVTSRHQSRRPNRQWNRPNPTMSTPRAQIRLG